MSAWLWVPLVVMALIGIAALVWWSSGRSRTRGIDTEHLTQEQRARLDANRIATTRNRDGLGGGPSF
jgi:hypothetical protein